MVKKGIVLGAILFTALCALPSICMAGENDEGWVECAAGSFSHGAGTKDDPYQIDTAEELALLAKMTNYGKGIFKDKYFVLTDNINLAGREWTPIGAIKDNYDSYLGFDGYFDGNGYTIYNMTITEDDNRYQFGLFGWNNGYICDVKLCDATITFESLREGWQAENGMGTSIAIGGIAGVNSGSIYNDRDDDGIIKDCIVENIKIDVKTTMSLCSGGLVGDVNYGGVENSYASGSISGISGRAIWIGGLSGSISNDATVKKCGFEGEVYGENDGKLIRNQSKLV